MVGRCISYWNSPFLGDMLVFGGVFMWDVSCPWNKGATVWYRAFLVVFLLISRDVSVATKKKNQPSTNSIECYFRRCCGFFVKVLSFCVWSCPLFHRYDWSRKTIDRISRAEIIFRVFSRFGLFCVPNFINKLIASKQNIYINEPAVCGFTGSLLSSWVCR